MLILGTASALMWALTWERLPVMMAQALLSVSDNPYVLLLLVNLLLLVLGCLMEGTALLIILTPILAPVFFRLGVDPVHFGLVIVLNLTIGAVTPPVGTILYTVCAIVGLSIEELTPRARPVPAGPHHRALRRHLRAADRPLAAQPDDGEVTPPERLVPVGFVDRLFRLDGQVALVTGGASGLGAAIARGSGKPGARVVIADLDLAGGQGVRERADRSARSRPSRSPST